MSGSVRSACRRRIPAGLWRGWRTTGEVLAKFASDPARVESRINDVCAEPKPECRLAPCSDEPSATTTARVDGADQRESSCEWGVTGELLGTSPLHPASVENQTTDVPAPSDEERRCADDEQRGGGVLAEVSRTSAPHPGSVASPANDVQVDLDRGGQLVMFEPPERDAVDWVNRDERRNRDPGARADKATGTRDVLSHAGADHAVLRELEEALAGARETGDNRPALVVLASRLGDLGTPRAPPPADRVFPATGARRVVAPPGGAAEEREHARRLPGCYR